MNHTTKIALMLLATAGSAFAQSKKEEYTDIVLGVTVDGDHVLIRSNDNKVTASVDGKQLPAARLTKTGYYWILKDVDGNPVAQARFWIGGGQVTRLARSNKVAIGIELGPLSRALADHLDIKAKDVIYVTRVIAGRAAAKAGLKDHDLIVALDGQSPVSEKKLNSVLAKKKPGDKLRVKVLRRGREQSLVVRCERAKGMGRPFSIFSDFTNQQYLPFTLKYAGYPTKATKLQQNSYSAAVKALTALQQNVSKTKDYTKFKKDFDTAQKALKKAQADLAKTQAEYRKAVTTYNKNANSFYFPSLVKQNTTLFSKTKKGKNDVLMLNPLYTAYVNQQRSANLLKSVNNKLVPSADLGKRITGLEKRFDRLEAMLEQLLKKRDN